MSERLKMIEKLISGGSTDPFHHYARAMELSSLERQEEALEAFKGVARDYPDYVPTYLMAAQLAQKLERVEEAQEWATRGVDVAQQAGDTHAARELSQFLDLLV